MKRFLATFPTWRRWYLYVSAVIWIAMTVWMLASENYLLAALLLPYPVAFAYGVVKWNKDHPDPTQPHGPIAH